MIAMSFRLVMIFHSPRQNENIDLKIYRDAGQLVANGVNPYDSTDHVKLRQQLRTDKDNYDPWVCSTQDRWNYYAFSNLPLATLFFGGIEYCFASPLAFRYTFAFFDSLLAVLIFAFIINKWRYRIPKNRILNKLPIKLQQNLPLLIGLSLGALSPILLIWGTYISEPKGIGLLLILSAIYFSDSSNKTLGLFISPVLLGFSVAFVGMGVFIGPLCLYNIYKNNVNGFRKIIFYCLVSFLACIISIAPFLPELIQMMIRRIGLAVLDQPQHGSMWLGLFKVLPNSWTVIRNIFILMFVGINIIGFLRKRLDVVVVSANLLFLFTCIYLMNGSMDRMNIALVALIILLGYGQLFGITTILWLVYLLYALFSFFYSYYHNIRQDFDGTFMLFFSILYLIILVVQTFSQHFKDETKHSYSSI
ncbi:MAG: hypothetical protein HOO91_11970 [Bacteroidales bacterium]|nr:hypothetical protein [Bacteroidales bacterium]